MFKEKVKNKLNGWKYLFGIRTRLIVIITLLLAGMAVSQLFINYRQQQAVIGKLMELNGEVNQAIRVFDRIRREEIPPTAAAGYQSQFETELNSFLDYVETNLENMLKDRGSSFEELEKRAARLRLLVVGDKQSEYGFQPDGGRTSAAGPPVSESSGFRRTISIIERITSRGASWHFEVTSAPPTSQNIERALLVSIPVIDEGQVRFINLQYQIDDFLGQFETYRLTSIIITGSVFLIGVIFAILFSNGFTRPIRIINTSFGRIEEGDLDCKIENRRNDEIGQLTDGFNRMVDKLREKNDLERALHRNERLSALGQMAAGVAHEVKNPLNAIKLTLQHLGDKLTIEDQKERQLYDKYSINIQNEVTRLGRIVDTLLDFAHVGKLETTRVDIAQVLEDVLTLVARDAQKKGIRLESSIQEGLIRMVDPEKMKTVFMNMVLNAIQAMPSGGRLNIGAYRDELSNNAVMVEFEDSGTGIEQNNIEKIFDLYYTTREGGSGLGLSIANNVVREHGGRIEVESALGTGSKFTIILP